MAVDLFGHTIISGGYRSLCMQSCLMTGCTFLPWVQPVRSQCGTSCEACALVSFRVQMLVPQASVVKTHPLQPVDLMSTWSPTSPSQACFISICKSINLYARYNNANVLNTSFTDHDMFMCFRGGGVGHQDSIHIHLPDLVAASMAQYTLKVPNSTKGCLQEENQ